MAFASLEDMYGSIELLLFPKIYEKYGGFLKNDALVVVTGRLSLREDEAPKILPDRIEVMESYLKIHQESGSGVPPEAAAKLEFRCDAALKDPVEAFIRFFSGDREVAVYNKDTGALLCGGYIACTQDILEELAALCDMSAS